MGGKSQILTFIEQNFEKHFQIEFAEEAKRKKLEFRNYGDNFAWNKRLRKPAK